MTNLAEVRTKVNHYYEVAERFYKTKFTRPSVDLNKRGTSAGSAYLIKKHISLNEVLLKENGEKFLVTTVPHEIAHLIAFTLYGDRGHGRYWKAVMEQCFGLPPKRCHTFDLSTVKSKREIVKYRCDCMEHHLSLRQHNNVLTLKKVYSCKSCKSKLFYINTKVETKKQKNPKDLFSKKHQAKMFIEYNKHLSRGEILEFFTDILELTENTSKIYYNKFKERK